MASKKKTNLAVLEQPEERGSRVPANETASERFGRVAGVRLQNAIAAMDLISKMGQSAGTTYDYDSERVERLVGHLQDAVDRVREALSKPGKKVTKALEF